MEEITSKLFVDGVVVIGDDWRILGEFSTLSLPSAIVIKVPTDYKGVQSLIGYKYVEIELMNFLGDIQLYIVVAHRNNGTDCFSIPFGCVRQSLLESIDYAIENLEGSKTKGNWFSLCCHKYSDWINSKTCKQCFNPSRKVFPEDLAEFGDYFQAKVYEKLLGTEDQMGNAIIPETKICLKHFGQNVPLSAALKSFRLLKMQHAEEIVLHIAKDFKFESKCLFWKRNRVSEVMQCAPQTSYYPLFMKGAGNFVFNFPSTVHDVNDGVPVTRNMKFYNNAFKEVHRGVPCKFKYPMVVDILMGRSDPGRYRTERVDDGQNKKNIEDINKILKWIQAVRRCYLNHVDANLIDARMEAIISLQHPSSNDPCKQIADFFIAEYGSERITSALTTWDFEGFVKQMTNSLMPALYTLRKVMTQFKDEEEVHVGFSFPGFDTCTLAAVCEVLICFCIYGKTTFWAQGFCAFDRTLPRVLNLQESTFNCPFVRFEGLKFSNCLKLKRNKTRIVYNGGLVFDREVVSKLSSVLEESDVRLLNTTLNNLLKEDRYSNFAQEVSDITTILWKMIIENGLQSIRKESMYTGNNQVANEEFSLMRRIVNEVVTCPMSSKDFAAFVLRDNSCVLGLNGKIIKQVVNSVKNLIARLEGSMSRLTLNVVQESLGKYIEKKIYKSPECMLSFSSAGPSQNVEWIVLLPLYPVNSVFSFSNLQQAEQKKIVELYEDVFSKNFGLGDAPDPKAYLQEIEQLGWGFDISMKDFMDRLLGCYKKY